ncbi:peptide deformylase [Crossiella sp. CA198]|uniref:peptide deformylase n=1 Tax=Crossiella sp. CA198 TaxID=3455607 RepID=UPI003F8D3055
MPDDDDFPTEFKVFRDLRGHSQEALGKRLGYDRSYINKIENGKKRPPADFVRKADAILAAGGLLYRAWESDRRLEDQEQSTSDSAGIGHGLINEHEDTTLAYNDGEFVITVQRTLVNNSLEPVERYPIRISVNRYPDQPDRYKTLYRNDPLLWEEIQLEAHCNGEPMSWQVKADHDAIKELYLLFKNQKMQFPLYPGETAQIVYCFRVPARKWGPWFQRAIRLPTKKLTVTLDFPMDLSPAVWGKETTAAVYQMPFRTPIHRIVNGDRALYVWTTDDPPLDARYRLEWHFKADPEKENDIVQISPAQSMADLGIVQVGADILAHTALPFDLPAEAAEARRVITELHTCMARVQNVHVFSKGMGVAAPQINIPRAAAVVRTAAGELITLLNPRIIDATSEFDKQYEGCLSFFDVRGMVPRPLAIQVEHTDLNGTPHITTFQRGLARLVAHEIDHLEGRLYTDLMEPGVEPIPVEQYRGTGHDWKYH